MRSHILHTHLFFTSMVAASVLKISQLLPTYVCVTPAVLKNPASFMGSVQKASIATTKLPIFLPAQLLCAPIQWQWSLSHLLIERGRGKKLVVGAACAKVFVVRNKSGPGALIHISEIIKESQSQLLGAPDNVTPY